MSNTTFVDFNYPAVNAAWLNDVNRAVYTLLGNSASAPLTRAELLLNLGVPSNFGTLASQNANAVAITGGTISGVTYTGNIIGNAQNVTGTVAIANGGTGATTASSARDTLGIGSTLSWRNKLINANGLINQRAYVSGVATTVANQYTLDRWRVVTLGQALTFSISGNTTTMTAPAGGLEQVVESTNNEGGVYTLSWTGTATATVNGAAVTNGGQTAALTAGTTITVRFTGGTVALPQLEKGSIVTPFEWRPAAIEADMCYWYCYRINCPSASTTVGTGAFYSTVGCQIHVQLPKAMRTTPSVTVSTSVWNGLSGAGSINLGSGTFSANNPNSISVIFAATVTAVAGDGVVMRSNASAWIQADAEL